MPRPTPPRRALADPPDPLMLILKGAIALLIVAQLLFAWLT